MSWSRAGKKLLLTWRRAHSFLACPILNQIEKRTGLRPHPGKRKTKQVPVSRDQQKKALCTLRSDFRGIGNPGTCNCRLKKRTGLGPHPTLEKPQFWPLFRGVSGVLKLNEGHAASEGKIGGTLSISRSPIWSKANRRSRVSKFGLPGSQSDFIAQFHSGLCHQPQSLSFRIVAHFAGRVEIHGCPVFSRVCRPMRQAVVIRIPGSGKVHPGSTDLLR